MKKRWLASVLLLSLVLTGCSWQDGSYVSIAPHREESDEMHSTVVSASDYQELIDVLEDMVSAGQESGVISLSQYDPELIDSQMFAARRHICTVHPVGAYAVEDISFELGTNGGRNAIAVRIEYRRSRLEIRNIRSAQDMDMVARLIGEALEDFDSVLTMQVDDYRKMDLEQIVRDYARLHPQTVMEVPQVSFTDYGNGYPRILELTFTYQNSRESLRQMQSQVKPVFDAAGLYVSGASSQNQKYSQLYAFLMERFDYKMETSITPAYSLLQHGVGDSKAFAEVYAAMCNAAGLECLTVNGTRNGEPWTWNIICENGNYYHVDLLRSNQIGAMRKLVDGEMGGYVWDYSAYPACVPPAPAVDPAEDSEAAAEETTVPTVPEEETAPEDETVWE